MPHACIHPCSTDAEFAAGHVPGATHAAVWVAGPGGMTPNAAFVQQVEALLPNKDTLLMVVSHACTLS